MAGKSYDIYGIGNALVDMEFEVEPEFLKKMGVEKGLMTLVDEKRQESLLSHLAGIQHKRGCGGSAANTVIAVAQFGGKSYYSCKVGNDETGDFYYSDLKKNGVHTNLSDKRQAGVTGKCMVFVTPDADRTMNTYLGISSTFGEAELMEKELAKAEFLYIEGYLITSPVGKKAAIKALKVAREHGVKTALTFSDPGVVGYFREDFKEVVGSGVDLLFANEKEAFAFTGSETPEEAMMELKKVAKTMAITRGPQGALLWDGEKELHIVTNKVKAVDTNGAGDLFAGAFLYAITQGKGFAEAGRLACYAASILVTQFGARLGYKQIQDIKQTIA